ncbi:MAG: tetratricopeptide repeat protein, partial [candidate division KSB1 bacterium]|nr:tetratricopeptide repeat protein [candidate division KSB1 bacterium]
AQFMIGYLYANEIKDLDKARSAYQVFLEKYPENELVPSVKWELDHLGKDISEIEFLVDTTKVVEKNKGRGNSQ